MRKGLVDAEQLISNLYQCWINYRYQDIRLYIHLLWIFVAIILTSILYVLAFLTAKKKPFQSAAGFQPLSITKPARALSSSLRTPDLVIPSPSPLSPLTLSRKDSLSLSTPTTSLTPSTPFPPTVLLSPLVTASTEPSTSLEALSQQSPQQSTSAIVSKQSEKQTVGGSNVPLVFLIYPLVYVACAAPFAIVYTASMAAGPGPAARGPPLRYLCVAGTALGLNGLANVLLYSLARRAVVFSGAEPSADTGPSTFGFLDSRAAHHPRAIVDGRDIESCPRDRRRPSVMSVVTGGRGPSRSWGRDFVRSPRGLVGPESTLWSRRRGSGSVVGGVAAVVPASLGPQSPALSLTGFGMDGDGEIIGMAIRKQTTVSIAEESRIDVEHDVVQVSAPGTPVGWGDDGK